MEIYLISIGRHAGCKPASSPRFNASGTIYDSWLAIIESSLSTSPIADRVRVGILFSSADSGVRRRRRSEMIFFEDYHHINRNFTLTMMATNYTETLLQGNDFILTRAANFLLPAMMRSMRRLTSILERFDAAYAAAKYDANQFRPSLLEDTNGHHLRAPEVLERREDSFAFDAKSRPWFIKQAKPVPSVGIPPVQRLILHASSGRLPSTNP